MHRLGIATLALLFLPPLLAAPGDTPDSVYTAACAACHGEDGRGAPPERVGLEMPLPDFTDCQFAPREPDSDWLAVTHVGGPGRAFAREMPAYDAALTSEQAKLAMLKIRSFCTDPAWPRGELNLPRPLATEKAFPEDEAVITTSYALDGPGAAANKLIYEKRLGARNQLEVIVPFSWQERRGAPGQPASTSGGIGDIALGMKRVMFHSLARGTIFSIAGEVKLPTGSESRGFGSGTAAFEPFLAFGQILPGDGFVHVQTGAELPFESGHDDEGFFRVAAGRSFTEGRFGRTWSPMVEVLGKGDLKSTLRFHWDWMPGVQVSLSTRQHILGAIGVRMPLNDRGDTDPQLVLYILWDWFDGGLTDGW
ncbi:MAG: transporter [Thermoanaerobaculia bacterium]